MRLGFLICAVLLLGFQPVAAQDQEATVYEVSDGVSRPIPTKTPGPRYSADAMRAKIEGLIRVEAIVRPDGTVGDVKLVQPVDSQYGLDEEAVAAARQWVFKPERKTERQSQCVCSSSSPFRTIQRSRNQSQSSLLVASRGAGNIFPIVIVFGTGLVVFAVGAGGTCGAGVRARRTHAG